VGIKLRVIGCDRAHELRLATNARYRGSCIAYSVEFPTKRGEWSEVKLRFVDLNPSHYGNPLDGPRADLSQVGEMSILIADKHETPFALKIDWMQVE